MNLIILLALAIAPGTAISIFIWLNDKYEKEPLKLVILSFILGAIAIIPAALLENACEKSFGAYNALDPGSSAFNAFAVTGGAEEFCKLLPLVLFAYRKPDFNEPFDGIVYSVMISMGFATVENILYVLDGGLTVAIMRMFFSVPAHATFGVIMGYFVGLAKFNKKYSVALISTGFLGATIFHGAFDYFLMLKSNGLLFLGALASLGVAARLSLQAIRKLSVESPFRTK